MQTAQPTLRQCADCYYRVDGACRAFESRPERRGAVNDEHCEMFTRASLRFAFFPRM